KTSSQRAETARAMAHPTTPPPIISMFAWSITLFYPRLLSIRIDFVEKWFALGKARLRSVMNRVNRVSLLRIMIAPKRRRSVRSIFVQRVKENVKCRQLFLVVVVVSRDARQRLQASLFR